jgi:hypothetical protein
MKRKKYILVILAFCLAALSAQGQNCEADFSIKRVPCHVDIVNRSDEAYKFKWVIDGKIYYDDSIVMRLNSVDTMNICLYTEDTVNNCLDTICKTLRQRAMKYDYYVYKQQVYITGLLKQRLWDDFYVVAWGDDNFANSYYPGIFKHSYEKPGRYGLVVASIDTIMINGMPRVCSFSKSDSIDVGGHSRCRSFFVPFVPFVGFTDTVLVFNRSMGENLKYYWDLGDGSSSIKKFPSHMYTSRHKINLCLTVVDTAGGCVSTYCDSIVRNTAFRMLSLGDWKGTPQVSLTTDPKWSKTKIFPNPFSSFLDIELQETDEPIEWEIIGNDGRRVMYGRFSPSPGIHTIDTHMLGAGPYMMMIKAGNAMTFERLLKID